MVSLTMFRDGEREQEEAEAIDATKATATRGLQVHQGSLEDFHGRTIAMSRSLMFDSGLHLGQTLKVAIADRKPIRVRLVAIVDDAPSLYGSILVPQALAGTAAHPGRWFVIPERGVDDPVAVLNSELRGTRARAESSKAWIASTDTDLRSNNTLVLWVLLGPGGFYAALAIANTLLMGSLQRHREFVSTRLIGATEQQVRAMVLWESALVTVASLTVGAATAGAVGLLIRRSLSDGNGQIPVNVPWQSLGLVAGTCLVVAVVAAIAPTAFMLRTVHPSQAAE
jgi:putative ABC transport system permease protein